MEEKITDMSKEERTIAIFVDGPNMLRKEFMIDLRELKTRALKYGRIVIARVFLNQFAPEKLIEAVINEGFESIMILAEQDEEASDVDVALAVAATEAGLRRDVDFVGIASRDADFLPVVQKIKEYGKKTVVFGAEPGFASSVQNAADYTEMM